MSDASEAAPKSDRLEPAPEAPAETANTAVPSVTADAAPAAPPPAPAEVPAFARGARDRKPRPFLGPWLWVSGVLLWAYVVMGIFVTSRFGPKRLPLGEGAAVFWVFAAWGSAAFLALRRSLSATGGGRPSARAAIIGLGSLAFWTFFVFVATLVGLPDGVASFFLIVLGGGLAFYGRRLTHGSRGFAGDNRLVTVALWIGAAVVTFAALVVR